MLSITLPVGSEHLVLDKALMYPCVSTFLTSFYTLQYSRAEAILQLPESKEDAHKTQVSPISDIWVLYNIKKCIGVGHFIQRHLLSENSINEKSVIGGFAFEPTNLAFGFISRDFS